MTGPALGATRFPTRGHHVRPKRAYHFCFDADLPTCKPSPFPCGIHSCCYFSMSRPKSAALDLLRAIYDLTDGIPQQWCMLEELRGATNSAAIYAFTRGWIVVEGGHSICLTDARPPPGGIVLAPKRNRRPALALLSW